MQTLDTKERASKVRALKGEVAKAEKKFKTLKAAKFGSLVSARNGYVAKGLQKELGAHPEHKPEVLVFCVSNEHYNLLKDGEDSGVNQLGPVDTGIPGLRAYTLALAGPAIMQTLDDYINHDFTVFLNGLGPWAVSRYIEGSEDLLAIVERPQETIGITLDTYQTELGFFIKENLEECLIKLAPKHSRAAQEMFIKKRQDRHPSTLKAFMRKGGKHKTKKCPEECWNEQFLDPTVKALTLRWGKVNTRQAELITQVKEEFVEETTGILRELKAFPGTEVLDMTNLELMLQGQAKGIENTVRNHQQEYSQEMKYANSQCVRILVS